MLSSFSNSVSKKRVNGSLSTPNHDSKEANGGSDPFLGLQSRFQSDGGGFLAADGGMYFCYGYVRIAVYVYIVER